MTEIPLQGVKRSNNAPYDGRILLDCITSTVIIPRKLSEKEWEIVLDTIEDAVDVYKVGYSKAANDFMGHAQSICATGYLRRTSSEE